MAEDRTINGIIKRIVYYTDGTAQIDLARSGNCGVLQESFPFFGNLDGKYLGRTVEVSEEYIFREHLYQRVIASDLKAEARSEESMRKKIANEGRIVLKEIRIV